MSVSLSLWPLKSTLDSKCSLKEVQGSTHLSDTPVVACHIIKCHCLTQFVIFAKLFRLFEEVKCTIDVFLLQIVDSQNVANFAKLFTRLCELLRIGTILYFFDFQELLKNTNCLYIFALRLILSNLIFKLL